MKITRDQAMQIVDYHNRVEEQIKDLWDKQEKVCDFANGVREGIERTLCIIGIRYKWLNGDAE